MTARHLVAALRAVAGAAATVAAGMLGHPSQGHGQAAPSPPRAPTPAADSAARMVGLTTQVPVIGADTVLEERVRAVASGLRCPVCQGLSLQDSPSELAQQMRAVVREQLAAGRSDDDVRAYFVAKYGDWVLLKPKAQGVAALAYALPVLFLVVGGGIVWGATRRWTRQSHEDATAP